MATTAAVIESPLSTLVVDHLIFEDSCIGCPGQIAFPDGQYTKFTGKLEITFGLMIDIVGERVSDVGRKRRLG